VGAPVGTEYERAQLELERAQAALVAALTGIGPTPAGFDTVRLDVARRALLRKRSGEVAKSWPLLRAGLGTQYLPTFGNWAAERPTAGGWRDGFAFASYLDQRQELPAAARAEWQRCRLQWSVDAAGTVRRRRWPAVAVVDGRVLVQIGGRVAGWGRMR
jgi:hypothetical protein